VNNDSQIQCRPTCTIFEKLKSIITMKTYTSGPLTIPVTGFTATAAHGLGAVPNIFSVSLVCVNAEGGYSAGDVINITGSIAGLDGDFATPGQMDFYADATNIGLIASNQNGVSGVANALTSFGTQYVNKGGSGNFQMVLASWKIRFDAILF
jgi:hypothetical protein